MSHYEKVISEAIEYIENNITQQLTLKDLAKEFHFSEHHFSRLFKVLTGYNLRQYIIGRRLAAAVVRLQTDQSSITDIAFDLGFEYPEVFSRAFKKQYGFPPTECKSNIVHSGQSVEKATIIERDIMNLHGGFTLKENFAYRPALTVCGVYLDINENDQEFNSLLATTCNRFLERSIDDDKLRQDVFYSVVACSGENDGQYRVYFGKEMLQPANELHSCIVPEGWYARFSYHGEMSSMRLTFTDDYYRWMVAKDITIVNNGIGMINIYDTQDVKNVQILIPALNKKNKA